MAEQGKVEVSFAAVMLLGGATLVASVLVFLLGIYVGKGMIETRLAADTRIVRQHAPTPGPSPKAGEDVTFWDRLAEGKPAVSQAPGATPTTVETPVRVAPAVSAARAEPTPARAEPIAPEERAAAEPTKRPEAAARPETARADAAARTESGGGDFQVQVNAMADRRRADALVQDLLGMGYKAYLSPAKRGQDTLYRVRVTGLASEEAAKAAVARLREQGYPRAFLVREGG